MGWFWFWSLEKIWIGKEGISLKIFRWINNRSDILRFYNVLEIIKYV